jgi:hypothetical protein
MPEDVSLWPRLVTFAKVLGLVVTDTEVHVFRRDSHSPPVAFKDAATSRVWVSWFSLRATVELKVNLMPKDSADHSVRMWVSMALPEVLRRDVHTELLTTLALFLGTSGRTFDRLRLALEQTADPDVWVTLLTFSWVAEDAEYLALLASAERVDRLDAIAASLQHLPGTVVVGYLQDVTARRPELATKLLDSVHPEDRAAAVATVHSRTMVKALFAARGDDQGGSLLALAKVVPSVCQELHALCFDTLMASSEDDPATVRLWEWCVSRRGPPSAHSLVKAVQAGRWQLVPTDLDDDLLRQVATIAVHTIQRDKEVAQAALEVLHRQNEARFKAVRGALSDVMKTKGDDDFRSLFQWLLALVVRS